jgi:hypothetical protein
MTLRERNALLAPLSGSGLRQIRRDRADQNQAPTVEAKAREQLARFLATLPSYSASDLMRRCFPFEDFTAGKNRLGQLGK